jgi:hypothetical protein
MVKYTPLSFFSPFLMPPPLSPLFLSKQVWFLLFLEFRQIHLQFRVAIFPKKNYSAEHGTDRTLIYFVGIPKAKEKLLEICSKPLKTKKNTRMNI